MWQQGQTRNKILPRQFLSKLTTFFLNIVMICIKQYEAIYNIQANYVDTLTSNIVFADDLMLFIYQF